MAEKIGERSDVRRVIADLHIHSKYSRATSKDLDFANLVKYAKIKGVGLLGTGDFTHPKWIEEIKKLKEKDIGGGIYYYQDFPFIITGEISLMYNQGKGRKVHIVILVPNILIAEKINSYLDTLGRRDYDGRPIFGISCIEFTKKMMEISPEIELIPAHCLLPDEVIHTNYSIKKIKDIKEGDLVYTHKNQWQKVSEVLVNDYNGKIINIKPWYFTEGLTATSNHPFYAIKSYKCSWIKGLCKKSCSKLNECKNKQFEKYLAEWVSASELKKGDFLIYPRFNKIKNCEKFDSINLDKNLCKLIGYYLAEGYTIREEGIGFSFNKNESDYINEVIKLIGEIFGKNKFKFDERKGKDIIFYSKHLNNFFSKFYNSSIKRANTKAIPNFMLELPLEKQVEMFKTWYRGDKGYTVSRELMNQMKLICLRLGIIPNISLDKSGSYEKRGKHFIDKRKIKSNHNLYSFGNLSFFEDKFNLLSEKEFNKFKTKLSRRHGWIDNNYIYVPIRDIIIGEYKGEVYNLEVEKDNSYTSEFACIHNCWTPWFGILGSKSGFDSLSEAFGDQVENIHAIETGLSSDPNMNWRLGQLDRFTIVSFSDSHSFWPWRIGREATIFNIEGELSYGKILDAIRKDKIEGTIEVEPAYGMYHYDGHRNCNFSCSPKETKKLNGICPECGELLTIGVDYRVDELADAERQEGYERKNAKKVYKLLPLHEVIALFTQTGLAAKKNWEIYNLLIEKFETEFNVLFDVSKEDLIKGGFNEKLAELVLRNRKSHIKVKPGYDGIYGQVILGEQKKLF